ncbi:MAG: carboxypeptidase-like regulatory domain-containing protein [Bacteroidota bacterium]
MSKSLRISIPEPCHEDWNQMTPQENGSRHCQSCARNIVDFTYMSDREIHRYIRNHNGRICGRWRKDQLERPIFDHQPKSSSLPRLAATAAGMLLSSGLGAHNTLGESLPIEEKTEETIDLPVFEKVDYEEPLVEINDCGPDHNIGLRVIRQLPRKPFSQVKSNTLNAIERLQVKEIILKGRVADRSTNDPLIAATCAVYNSETGELETGNITNIDGNFYFHKVSPNIRMEVTYTGYDPVSVDLSKHQIVNGVMDVGTIYMEQQASIMMMGVIAPNWKENTDNSINLRGQITDEATDEPLVAASIQIQGTPKGTVTDLDGRYELEVENGQTLIVSYTGYQSKKIIVQRDTREIDLALKSGVFLNEFEVRGQSITEREVQVMGLIVAYSEEELKVKEETPTSDAFYLSEITLFPNPNPMNDYIGLEINPATPTTLKAKLFDMEGRLLRSWADRKLHAGKQQIRLGVRYMDLIPGHYYLLLEDASGQTETRVVIKQNHN